MGGTRIAHLLEASALNSHLVSSDNPQGSQRSKCSSDPVPLLLSAPTTQGLLCPQDRPPARPHLALPARPCSGQVCRWGSVLWSHPTSDSPTNPHFRAFACAALLPRTPLVLLYLFILWVSHCQGLFWEAFPALRLHWGSCASCHSLNLPI